jgi:uncharacterized protein YaaN involved in tellurite resistance
MENKQTATYGGIMGLDDLLKNSNETNTLMQKKETKNTPKSVALMEGLPEDEQIKAKEIANNIQVGNYEAILTFGSNAQNELASFSHRMLDHIQSKDVGPIGDILNDLMKRLNEINPEELSMKKKNKLQRIFSRATKSLQELMTKYQSLSTQIDRIGIQLEYSKKGLIEDVNSLEELYAQNKVYFQSLNIYIAAAELKREEIINEIIPALRQKAEDSSDQMMYQEVNDMVQFLDRLEKRLYDLQLSRQITIQSAPQIRMIQQTNSTLAEKIQSSVMTSIPLWKNQIAIALTLNRQLKAVEAQKQVTKTTNNLMLRNSEMLRMNSIEVAKENELGIIEIDTLKKTQENLLLTIQETLQIQADGRVKRKEAELQISKMEDDLKQRLLGISEGQKNQVQ